ncbi:hypothetical protein RND71_025309 [Anisodus tanguticus]|uniref:Uncharacterized protein n=1 Tax=Anisodus tanguticus TaxID=243964 RepID=A0AAE1RR56_9SOLA|nr:hypothetical protein RND71_025309 [Anisodus tanguticus]
MRFGSAREFFFEQLVTISIAVSLIKIIQRDTVIFKAPEFLSVLQPQAKIIDNNASSQTGNTT